MYADLSHGQHGTVVSVATQCVLNYIPGLFLGDKSESFPSSLSVFTSQIVFVGIDTRFI